MRFADRLPRLERFHKPRLVPLLHPRDARTDVGLFKRALQKRGRGQEALLEHAVRLERRAVRPACLEVCAAVERTEDAEKLLHDGNVSAAALVFPQIRGLTVAQSVRADLALLLEPFERFDRVGNRKAFAHVMHDDRIEIVGLHAFERILDVAHDRRRARVVVDGVSVARIMEIAALAPPVQRALGLQDEIVPAALQRFAQKPLAFARAVDRRGVDVVDAEVFAGGKQVDRLAFGRIVIRPHAAAAETPRAECDGGDGKIAVAEFAVLHKNLPGPVVSPPVPAFIITERAPGFNGFSPFLQTGRISRIIRSENEFRRQL